MPKNWTILRLLLYPLGLLGLLTGCSGQIFDSVEITDKEICIYVDTETGMGCTNLALPEGKQHYTRQIENGDVVTNSDDAVQATNELLDLLEEFKKCQAGI